jgi:hypothetical protein
MIHIVFFPRTGNAQRLEGCEGRNDAGLAEILGFGDPYNFTVKEFQALDQSGHFAVEHLR